MKKVMLIVMIIIGMTTFAEKLNTDGKDHLKEILGEVHREDLLDTLFSKFCLGK